MTNSKSIPSTPFIFVLMGAVLAGCHKEKEASESAQGPSGPPPAVVVAPVDQQTVPIYREFTARTDANATVDLRARVKGILEEQNFEEGKPVKKDQVLFRIDARPFQAALESAEAKFQKSKADLAYALKQVSVRAAEADLAQAKAVLEREDRELERTTALTEEGVQTKQDLEAAIARQRAALAKSQFREAQLENAKLTEDANIKVASA